MRDPIEARDPEAQFASPDVKGMAAAITVTAQISQNRSIVVQTYLDRDAPVKDFHDVLDKFGKAIERQEAKAQIEEHRANLAVEEKTFKQVKEDYLTIDARSQEAWTARGKAGQHRLNEAERAQKANAETTIRRYEEAIAKRKADIARLEALINEGS